MYPTWCSERARMAGVLIGVVLVAALAGGCSDRTPKATEPASPPSTQQPADEPAEPPQDAPLEGETPGASEAVLEGVPWTMTLITSEDGGGLVGSAENGAPTITFAKGKVAGNAGINSFSGEYSTTGDKLTITAAAVTKMAGDVDLLDQESAFFAALSRTQSYRIESGELRLLAEDGSTVLVFAAP